MERPSTIATEFVPPARETRRTHPGRRMPERLGPGELRAFSKIETKRGWLVIFEDWAIIAAAIVVAELVNNLAVTLLAIAIIGTRQMALAIVGHEAAHFVLFPNRSVNDWVGNLFGNWPVFISVEGFRHYHVEHHRALEDVDDGNRELWTTHNKDGERTREWTYPKTPAQLGLKLLWRGCGPTGVWWIIRGLVGGFLFRMPLVMQLTRIGFYAIVVAAVTLTGTWWEFTLYWLIPFVTWQVAVQYLRLICEHSNTDRTGVDPDYALTRSTSPGFLARFFFLPHNVGYHLEHHGYPGVPYYNLPKLHDRLNAEERFRDNANVHTSLWSSLTECTKEPVIVLTSPRDT